MHVWRIYPEIKPRFAGDGKGRFLRSLVPCFREFMLFFWVLGKPVGGRTCTCASIEATICLNNRRLLRRYVI